MGAIASKSVAGNSIPFARRSWYTWTTPDNSGWRLNASAHDWIKLNTFSWTAVGGSFLGPINFTCRIYNFQLLYYVTVVLSN